MASRLRKMELCTTRDLCFHFPARYEDRSKVVSVENVPLETPVSVRGILTNVSRRKTRSGLELITAALTDGMDSLRLTWFNGKYLYSRLLALQHKEITVYGGGRESRYGAVITGGEVLEDPETGEIIVPVYSLTEGISQNMMRRFVQKALEYEKSFLAETLPDSLRARLDLPGLREAVFAMHYPEDPKAFARARRRLAFEELFVLQLALTQRKRRQALPGKGIPFVIPEGFFADFEKMFPFSLTEGQKRSIKEIAADMQRPDCMNRLLQGDVGSGKTLAALAAMLICCSNGRQAAIMAPTEILAEQHYLNITSLLGDKAAKYPAALLKGSLKAAEKREALLAAESGDASLIIGTHALISDRVSFKNLGLVVVDEQHRFGVLQRTALYGKAGTGPGARPDMLLMTATPIPRTLTNAVYGDLDVSVIDTMPAGRQPVKTHWKKPEERPAVYKALKTLTDKGLQAYVVCPLIEGSEQISARAATELFCELSEKYFPGTKVALLHGQQPTEEKEQIMASFRRGDTKILVSTSVIEVGVDVPNAVCMIIESADRFGLSQLHQLRGRVGRGKEKGFCILISDGATEESRKRLGTMTSTNDGFVIAEEDLKQRGPGELSGVRQSGLSDFRVANIFRDGELLREAKALAKQVIGEDPELSGSEWQRLRPQVAEKTKELEGTTD